MAGGDVRPRPAPAGRDAVADYLAALTAELTSSNWQVWAPVMLAAGASLTRAGLAGRAAGRCLATRAALT